LGGWDKRDENVPVGLLLKLVIFSQVYPDGRPNMCSQGSKASIREFYGTYRT